MARCDVPWNPGASWDLRCRDAGRSGRLFDADRIRPRWAAPTCRRSCTGWLTNTATSAGLPAGDIDLRDRRLTQAGAIGIILATYLLITASPSWAPSERDDSMVMQPVDYGSLEAWRDLAMRLGQIGDHPNPGADLHVAGYPPRSRRFPPAAGCSPIPALGTVAICVAGQIISILVLKALTPAGANTDVNGGGSVDNGWGWLQIIDAVHTSIVEEIIVVAVPVLVGRTAGWHPGLVIAVCAFLRWPYHAYHGVLITLPWAMIWGGAFAGAYLYLRRLTPIIVVHFLIDLPIMLGDVTPSADPITYLIAAALLVWLLALGMADRRRRGLRAEPANLDQKWTGATVYPAPSADPTSSLVASWLRWPSCWRCCSSLPGF